MLHIRGSCMRQVLARGAPVALVVKEGVDVFFFFFDSMCKTGWCRVNACTRNIPFFSSEILESYGNSGSFLGGFRMIVCMYVFVAKWRYMH